MQTVEGRAGLAFKAGGRVSDVFDGYPVHPVGLPAESFSAFLPRPGNMLGSVPTAQTNHDAAAASLHVSTAPPSLGW